MTTPAATARQRAPLLQRLYNLWRRRIARNRLFAPAAIIALAAFILDQASKLWIVHGLKLPETGARIPVLPFLNFTYVENYGISFGLFRGGLASRVILSALAIGVAAGLIFWLAKLRRPLAAFGVALIIGGALGNAFDRVAYGYVVDFLDASAVHHPWLSFRDGIRFVWAPFHWVFNVADTWINIGIAMLLVDMIREELRARRQRKG